MFNWLRPKEKTKPTPAKLDTNPYESIISFGQVGEKVYVNSEWFSGDDEKAAENLAAMFIFITHGNSAQVMLGSFETICRQKNKMHVYEMVKQRIGEKLTIVENQIAKMSDEPIVYPSEAFGASKINRQD